MKSTDDMLFGLTDRLCEMQVEAPWVEPFYLEMLRRCQRKENNGWKRRTGMTQHAQILSHMKKAGSITQREAYLDYSIQSFSKRISELREAGHNIRGERKTHPTTGQFYTRYYLES